MNPSTLKIIKPQPGPQEMFADCQADIAIYGGQAGGGKTWSLVFEPLKYMKVKDANASIFRRTFSDITNQGGLWDEAYQMYTELGAKPNNKLYSFTFKGGLQVKFCHLQTEEDKYNYKGAQIAIILFDELTSFTETQFWYLMSRNRTKSKIKPYIRATTNPDATSWVLKLVEWWIDDNGYAIPERSGIIRYFINKENELIWANTPEELTARFPGEIPMSFTFIPASLEDNPMLMSGDPMYKARLMNLPKIERERLLGGNWKIVDDDGIIGAFLPIDQFKSEYLVAFIDTSFSDSTNTDRTSVSVVGYDVGLELDTSICNIEFTGKSWQKSITHPDVINELLLFLDMYKPVVTCVESQLSDSTNIFIDRFRDAENKLNIQTKNHWVYKHQTRNKHERIMTYVSANKHRMRVLANTDKPYINPVINYSKKVSKDRNIHDDEIDSLAGAVNLWLTSPVLKEYIIAFERLKRQRGL